MKKLFNSQFMKKSPVILTTCCLFLNFIFLCNIAFAVSVTIGEPAPEFTLPSVEGPTVSLHDFKGSVVVLIYFRADQKRSTMALEEIKTIQAEFREKDVQFIGIRADSEKKDALPTEINELNIDFPVLLDLERDVYGSYGIRVYPTTLIIDREGKFIYGLPGHALTYKIALKGHLKFILGEITEKEMEELVHPHQKQIDEATLLAHRKYHLALKFTEARLFDQAIGFVKQSIAAGPDMAKSHILLGYLFLDAKETDNAIDQFNTALHIDPSSKDAGTGLGAALIEINNFDRAIDVLTKALFLNPIPERTLYELGRAYELKGDKENAAVMYKKSIGKIVDHHLLPSSAGHCR